MPKTHAYKLIQISSDMGNFFRGSLSYSYGSNAYGLRCGGFDCFEFCSVVIRSW